MGLRCLKMCVWFAGCHYHATWGPHFFEVGRQECQGKHFLMRSLSLSLINFCCGVSLRGDQCFWLTNKIPELVPEGISDQKLPECCFMGGYISQHGILRLWWINLLSFTFVCTRLNSNQLETKALQELEALMSTFCPTCVNFLSHQCALIQLSALYFNFSGFDATWSLCRFLVSHTLKNTF